MLKQFLAGRLFSPAGLSFVFFALLSVALGQDVKRPLGLELTPCQVPGVTDKVLCGSYEVFEDREARKGRKITLKVVVA